MKRKQQQQQQQQRQQQNKSKRTKKPHTLVYYNYPSTSLHAYHAVTLGLPG